MEPVDLESFNKNREFLGYKKSPCSSFQKQDFEPPNRRKMSLASPKAYQIKSKTSRKLSAAVTSSILQTLDTPSQVSLSSKDPASSENPISDKSGHLKTQGTTSVGLNSDCHNSTTLLSPSTQNQNKSESELAHSKLFRTCSTIFPVVCPFQGRFTQRGCKQTIQNAAF